MAESQSLDAVAPRDHWTGIENGKAEWDSMQMLSIQEEEMVSLSAPASPQSLGFSKSPSNSPSTGAVAYPNLAGAVVGPERSRAALARIPQTARPHPSEAATAQASITTSFSGRYAAPQHPSGPLTIAGHPSVPIKRTRDTAAAGAGTSVDSSVDASSDRRSKRRIRPWLHLPAEIVIEIMAHLSPGDHKRCSLVSLLWHSCAAPFLWRHPRLESLVQFTHFADAIEGLILTKEIGSPPQRRGARSASVFGDDSWRLRIRSSSPGPLSRTASRLESMASSTHQLVPQRTPVAKSKRSSRLSPVGRLVTSLTVGLPAPSTVDGLRRPLPELSVQAPHEPPAQSLFCGSRRITDSHLIPLIGACPNLKSIGLYHCARVTDETVATLVSFCPHITEICLSGTAITNHALSLIARIGARLTHLALPGHVDLSEHALQILIRTCPNLRYLDLSGCYQISDVLIQDLAFHSLHLHTLLVAKCYKLSATVPKILSRHAKLEVLDLSHCPSVALAENIEPPQDDSVDPASELYIWVIHGSATTYCKYRVVMQPRLGPAA
ncbi:uncharacterized protein BJ171DRAFT_472998 [Polychytrium aggregatum]|uniref:uncharacterized protein n=1 Tax=Polychytrium aggregatum TaxID=110093 RepID=UPI0022FE8BCC|nr:uncharacterized protein BJ171DRAFT_472998 [Polychytrium aggregatum]KAI9207029.1 hypothetical protein BJ171DRAFT_472998 [Polychytrium aggregatum]